MPTTMVGDHELESVTVETGCSEKEGKMAGLINSFFEPKRKMKVTNPLSDSVSQESSTNSAKGSEKVSPFEECSVSLSASSTGPNGQSSSILHRRVSDTKASTLFHERNVLTPSSVKISSQKVPDASAVKNSLKHFSNSGSDFEEDAVLTTKPKKGQKSVKKRERKIRSIKKSMCTDESKEKSLEHRVDEECKKVSRLKYPDKRKDSCGIVPGSNLTGCSQGPSEKAVNFTEFLDKEIKLVGSAHKPAVCNSSGKPCPDSPVKSPVEGETRTSAWAESEKEKKISALDILMKSQRERSLQKLDSSGVDPAKVEMSFEDTSDTKCEVFDVVENPQINENVSCQSKSMLMEERASAFDILMMSRREQSQQKLVHSSIVAEASNDVMMYCENTSDTSCSCEIVNVVENLPNILSSDKVETVPCSGTNAFSLLMKKGNSGKIAFDDDCKTEFQYDSKGADNNSLCGLRKRQKKKPFEFELSIRASAKTNFELPFDSNDLNTKDEGGEWKDIAVKNVEKKKHKKTKVRRTKSGECISEGRHKDDGKISKSKREKGKLLPINVSSSITGTANVSFSEVNPEEVKERKNRTKSASQRKSTSSDNKGSAEKEEVHSDKDFQTPAKSGRRRTKRIAEEKSNAEVKGKNVRENRNGKKTCGRDFQSEQGTSTEIQQCFIGISEDVQDGRKSEIKEESKMKLSACDSTRTEINFSRSKNSNERSDIGRKKDTSREPKAVAAIFLKKRVVSTNPASDKCSSSVSLASSSAGTTTMEQKACDLQVSQLKEMMAEEKEAARKAFNALFAGSSSQKPLAVVSMTEALPAPWPIVSHVQQRDEDACLGVNFWCLPWPLEKGCRYDVLKHFSLHDAKVFDAVISSSSTHKSIMFCGQKDLPWSKKLDMKPTQNSFPEAVVKKLLEELALFYPGIPLRKLYKRYSRKLEKHKGLIVTGETQQSIAEKCTLEKNTKESEEKKKGQKDLESRTLGIEKGRRKRKLSSDDGICQENKITRRHEDFCESQPSEDTACLQSTRKRKKRGRDDGEDIKKETKGRRLSRRLREKNASVELTSVDAKLPESVICSHKRKLRRTTDSQEESSEMLDLSKDKDNALSEAVVSDSAKSLSHGLVHDALWTDLYRPVLSSEVMANASAVSKLRSWLEEWKIKREKTLRKELQQQKRLLAKQKGTSLGNQSQTVEWWDADGDSDFQMSDDALDDSDSEGGGLSTAMFISGPTGVGKTAMVYACAEELGYKVFEVNSSSKRSGKQIVSQLEEATQSHLVIITPTSTATTTTVGKGADPGASFTGFKSVVDASHLSEPLNAFLQPTGSALRSKNKKAGKERKGKNEKRKKEKLKEKGLSILKQQSKSVSNDEADSNLSSKAASLILFEEVDVIFEEDKSFWFAVSSFMQNAKCPIVLTSTESQISCEGRFDHVICKPPSVNLLSAHLQLVGLMNKIFINPEDIQSLVACNSCDIRKSLLDLQFWVESGGGIKVPYKRPLGWKTESHTKGDRSENPKLMSVQSERNTCDFTSYVAHSQEHEPAGLTGVLADGGEESMFLSLSDWEAIKNGSARPSLPSPFCGSQWQTKGNNPDSDFSQPKKKMLLSADHLTDSIFESTDTNDSQQNCNDDKSGDDSLPLPQVDQLLFESVCGLLNCVPEPAMGILSCLQKEEEKQPQENSHLLHFSQGLGVELTYTNFSAIMPLFAESTISQSSKKLKPSLTHCQSREPDSLVVTGLEKPSKSESLFSDTSLFDDGTEARADKVADVHYSKALNYMEKDVEESNYITSQESTDTGFSESQVKAETGDKGHVQCDSNPAHSSDEPGNKLVHQKSSNEEVSFKALEIFAKFADTMSYLDAFCPNLSYVQQVSSQFDYWQASCKPGLSDEYVTLKESSDWLIQDTRDCIRGSLEVANLDYCHLSVKSLSQNLNGMVFSNKNHAPDDCTVVPLEKETQGFDLSSIHLPPRVCNTVLHLDTVSQEEKSVKANRMKLYKSLAPCIPSIYHCNHRLVACDYIPAFRLLCHLEKLREVAHLKRRFLHYLSSNSFSLSRSTMDALAECYLGYK